MMIPTTTPAVVATEEGGGDQQSSRKNSFEDDDEFPVNSNLDGDVVIGETQISDDQDKNPSDDTSLQINADQNLSGNNTFDNTCDNDVGSNGGECDNNTRASEGESPTSVNDRIDNSSSSNNNNISSGDSADCDSDSLKDKYLEGDEEAQILQQTILDDDIEPDKRSYQGDESDIKEDANKFDRDDENARHDMPQSSLHTNELGEASIESSDKIQGEETRTPLLQDDDDSHWNKEDVKDAVVSFDAKCAREEIKQDVENPPTAEPEVVARSSAIRKKVKNRYCKAFVMVTVVWTTMIILVSVALGKDWFGVHFDPESLCTLCDENGGIGSNYSAISRRPTREPSSLAQSTFVEVAKIRPPPENLAELCAPSILLEHGSKKIPSVQKIGDCAAACLPATCCVSEDDQARQALTTLLASQGMGVQAATLFSNMHGCNSGDNIAICDSYNDFCSTLYDLDHALDSMQKHFRRACIGDITPIPTAFARAYDASKRTDDECKSICASLACCYETVDPKVATGRKRNREHSVNYVNTARRTMEFRQFGESGCDGFSTLDGSLNAQICNTYSTAYSIFCKSEDIPRSVVPTGTPSQQSSNEPSYQVTLSPTTIPSTLPTMRSSPVSTQPSYDASSTQPSSFPTSVPSSSLPQPSQLPTISSYHSSHFSSTNDTSIPSSFPTTAIRGDFTPSQPPTITSQPSSSPFINSTPACSIVNSTIFISLVPNSTATFAGFCDAVEAWNTNNATTNIFAAENEMNQRHELAAFFGHVAASQHWSQCQNIITDSNGKVYCKPDAYFGGNYTDPYCSTLQSLEGGEQGCNCGPMPESSLFPGYIESDKLFYGRGPLQLSGNYNYLEIAEVLGVDLCSRPDLVVSEEAIGWASAFWFWTSIPASTGKTSAISVAEGSFGGTLNAIKGGLECQTGMYSSDYLDEVTTRLDHYCNAASTLGVDKLLEMDSCKNLRSLFDTCRDVGSCPACRDFV